MAHNKSPWTPKEDAALLKNEALHQDTLFQKWEEVSKNGLSGRTPGACRKRIFRLCTESGSRNRRTEQRVIRKELRKAHANA